MLPQLVPEDELTKTNSKVATLRIMSALFAPVIGASLYVRFGVTVLFFINGVSFLISGVSEMFIQYKHVRREITSGLKGILDDLGDGIEFIMNNRSIRKLCGFFLVIYAFLHPIFGVILPFCLRQSLGMQIRGMDRFKWLLYLGCWWVA